MDQILYFLIRDVQIPLQYNPGSSKWAISLDMKTILQDSISMVFD